jgi:hypothetical protein
MRDRARRGTAARGSLTIRCRPLPLRRRTPLRDNATEGLQAKMLTANEARRIAANIARLPTREGRTRLDHARLDSPPSQLPSLSPIHSPASAPMPPNSTDA